jgi:enamine deaminase RidA (YjgF/YER057c/UK114 family)
MFRFLVCLFLAKAVAVAQPPRVLESGDVSSGSVLGAVRVVSVEGVPLVHTRQFLGSGPDLKTQVERGLAGVDAALRAAGGAASGMVRLNVYVTRENATPVVEAVLASRFKGGATPVVSIVTTRLPDPEALVAFDAVGSVGGAEVGGAGTQRGQVRLGAGYSVLPVGPRVYVSGQAEKGDGTPAGATRQTLASLERTLSFLGLGKGQVVQVKSFLTPMEKHAEVEAEMASFFGADRVPPLVCVEWKSPLPIEIELVVAAPGLETGPALEVRTPPGMTAPAVYSRLTIVRHPVSLYTGSLFPEDPKAAPADQLRSLFRRLKQCLDLGGSDWTHLAKATYYVSDEELSRQHNLVRPDYFNPRRPPAASKASVAGTGLEGRGISMDFIVVPGE